MLFVLAARLLATAIQAPPPPDLPALVAALDAAGYSFTPVAPKSAYGTLRHDGTGVEAALDGFAIDGPVRLGYPLTVSLRIELQFSKEIADGRSPILSLYGPDPRPGEIAFVSHLGRTVTATDHILLPADLDPVPLKTGLDAFWKAVGDFARSHGGRFEGAPKTDGSKVRFPDDAVLPRADPVSVGRLLASWGWEYKKAWSHSGNSFGFPVTVDGTDLLMRWPGTAQPFDAFVTLNGFAGTQDPERIDLSHGMCVGEFRRRIEAFARRQAAHDREDGPGASRVSWEHSGVRGAARI